MLCFYSFTCIARCLALGVLGHLGTPSHTLKGLWWILHDSYGGWNIIQWNDTETLVNLGLLISHTLAAARLLNFLIIMIPKWGSVVVSSESWTSSAIQNGTK